MAAISFAQVFVKPQIAPDGKGMFYTVDGADAKFLSENHIKKSLYPSDSYEIEQKGTKDNKSFIITPNEKFLEGKDDKAINNAAFFLANDLRVFSATMKEHNKLEFYLQKTNDEIDVDSVLQRKSLFFVLQQKNLNLPKLQEHAEKKNAMDNYTSTANLVNKLKDAGIMQASERGTYYFTNNEARKSVLDNNRDLDEFIDNYKSIDKQAQKSNEKEVQPATEKEEEVDTTKEAVPNKPKGRKKK